MALTVTVTPQETWPAGTKVTLDRLRKTAKPAVSVTGGLSASDLANDSVTKAKIKHEAFFYGTDSGTAAALSITNLSPVPAGLVNGLMVIFKVLNNVSADCTLSVHSLPGSGGSSDRPVYKLSGDKLDANDLRANDIALVVYNTSLDSGSGGWILINRAANEQVQYVTTAGTQPSYTATLPQAIIGYYAGLIVQAKIHSTNSSGAATLALNGLAAQNIHSNGSAVTAGQIAANQVYLLIHDGTQFQVANPTPIEFYLTASGSAGAYTASMPANHPGYVSGLRVILKANHTNSGAATLELNSLGAKTIKKGNGQALTGGEIVNNSIALLNYDGTDFLLANARASFTASGLSVPAASASVGNQAHSLGVVPSKVHWRLVNNSTAAGYSSGDEIDVSGVYSENGRQTFTSYADATNLNLIRNDTSTEIWVLNKSSGVATNIASATSNWRLKVYAEL